MDRELNLWLKNKEGLVPLSQGCWGGGVGERSENLGFPRVGCDLMHDGDSYIWCDNDSYRDNCFYSHCNANR